MSDRPTPRRLIQALATGGPGTGLSPVTSDTPDTSLVLPPPRAANRSPRTLLFAAAATLPTPDTSLNLSAAEQSLLAKFSPRTLMRRVASQLTPTLDTSTTSSANTTTVARSPAPAANTAPASRTPVTLVAVQAAAPSSSSSLARVVMTARTPLATATAAAGTPGSASFVRPSPASSDRPISAPRSSTSSSSSLLLGRTPAVTALSLARSGGSPASAVRAGTPGSMASSIAMQSANSTRLPSARPSPAASSVAAASSLSPSVTSLNRSVTMASAALTTPASRVADRSRDQTRMSPSAALNATAAIEPLVPSPASVAPRKRSRDVLPPETTAETGDDARRAKRVRKAPAPVTLLGPTLTKDLFSTFARGFKVSTGTHSVVASALAQFSSQVIEDVCAFSDHAKRESLSRRDFELLFYRQRLTQTPDPLATDDLIRQFLNMEDVSRLIPVARARNKVVPALNASEGTTRKRTRAGKGASAVLEDAQDLDDNDEEIA